MGAEPPDGVGNDDAPLVAGMLERAAHRSSRTTRARVQWLLEKGLAFKLLVACVLATAIGIPWLSYSQTPTLGGFFSGLFAGLFLALLVSLVGLALIVWARKAPRAEKPASQALVGELDRLLAPTLRELESLRQETIRAVKARSVTRLPAGIVVVVLLNVYHDWQTGLSVLDLLGAAVVGAILGEGWAIWTPHNNYRRQYKARVLPVLAGRFGELAYRPATTEDVKKLRDRGILPRYTRATAEDEIAGNYRGMAVSIVEAKLSVRQGKRSRVVFDGLLVGLTLPRNLHGTTVVVPDGGPLGNLKGQWRSGGLERVTLEDPRFEKCYEVYGNDQVEARALLTPAFIERFMALEKHSGLAPPGTLAEGNVLTIACPKEFGKGDLFEPPVYWKPSGGQELIRISEDIEAVLAVADAVIALDFWAEGRKRSHMEQRRAASAAAALREA
jgi:hypothetical protein